MSSSSASKCADDEPNTRPPGAAVGAQARGGGVDRAQHHPHPAAVERMGQVDLGPGPLQPVALQAERGQRRRPGAHRVRGRAVVVQQAREGQLAGAGAAADACRRPRSPSPTRPGWPARRRTPGRWARSRRRWRCSRRARPACPRVPGTARRPARAGARPCPPRRPRPPRARRRRRPGCGSAASCGARAGTPGRSRARRRARSRSAPAPRPAAGGRGSARRRSCSRTPRPAISSPSRTWYCSTSSTACASRALMARPCECIERNARPLASSSSAMSRP